jgi:hypothetical protein
MNENQIHCLQIANAALVFYLTLIPVVVQEVVRMEEYQVVEQAGEGIFRYLESC